MKMSESATLFFMGAFGSAFVKVACLEYKIPNCGNFSGDSSFPVSCYFGGN
jgi:hypothetical protein